jgi:hypothetical protein
VHVFADDDDAGERKDDDASEDAAEREIENILLSWISGFIYICVCVQKETSVLLSLSARVCVCDLAFKRTRAYDVRLFG